MNLLPTLASLAGLFLSIKCVNKDRSEKTNTEACLPCFDHNISILPPRGDYAKNETKYSP